MDTFTWPQVTNAAISTIGTTIALWIAYKTTQLAKKVETVEIKVNGELEALVKALEENGVLKETIARAEGEIKGHEEERSRRNFLEEYKLEEYKATIKAEADLIAGRQEPPPPATPPPSPVEQSKTVVLTDSKPDK